MRSGYELSLLTENRVYIEVVLHPSVDCGAKVSFQCSAASLVEETDFSTLVPSSAPEAIQPLDNDWRNRAALHLRPAVPGVFHRLSPRDRLLVVHAAYVCSPASVELPSSDCCRSLAA